MMQELKDATHELQQQVGDLRVAVATLRANAGNIAQALERQAETMEKIAGSAAAAVEAARINGERIRHIEATTSAMKPHVDYLAEKRAFARQIAKIGGWAAAGWTGCLALVHWFVGLPEAMRGAFRLFGK